MSDNESMAFDLSYNRLSGTIPDGLGTNLGSISNWGRIFL